MNNFNLVFLLLVVFIISGRVDSQNLYYFNYQMVFPEAPQLKYYEYHEWSPESHFSMLIDSSEMDDFKLVEKDERGLPERIRIFPSLKELSTVRPMYKNKQEGYIIRTVGDPDGFYTNPQMILIKEDYFEFDWEITGEQKVINDLLCVKAITDFRCKQHTAWFAPEIPVPSGPLFFHGLPGLIVQLEAEDIEAFLELRNFGPLTERTLNTEKLGLNVKNLADLPTHCDLQEVFNRYVRLIKARASDPDCRNCDKKITNVRWRECWEECH